MIHYHLRQCLMNRLIVCSRRKVTGYRQGSAVDLSHDVKVHELISSMKNEERLMLYEELRKVIQEDKRMKRAFNGDNKLKALWKNSSDKIRNYIDKPTRSQLSRLFIFHSLPYIAFGFLDNSIMLLAGTWIEQKIGSRIGISTLASAGLGNAVADALSIAFAYHVERFFNKMAKRPKSMKLSHFELKRTRYVIQVARVAGIVLGCLLGMTPLLFR